MSTPAMPRDFAAERGGGGAAIQMLCPTGVSLRIPVLGAGSIRLGPFPAGASVMIFADTACLYRFGDGTVVASTGVDSDPLPANQDRYFHMLAGVTHIAAVLAGGAPAGLFHVRELI